MILRDYMQKVLKKDGEIVVLVDHREKKSRVYDYLKKMKISLRDVHLKVGDYIISDRTVIERKEAKDFIKSIIDGRLFEQRQDLKENFNNSIIMVEGTFNNNGNMSENAIKAAIASIVIDRKISFISTKNEKDTAKMIYWLARKEQDKNKREIGIKGKKKPKDIKKYQEHIVSSLPNVSTITSKKLLKEFGSVKKVFTAKEKDLKKIKGLGEKKVKKILGIIKKKY